MALSTSLRQQIDQVFQPWDRTDSPGAALLVLQQGEIAYARGYGMANLEYELPIATDTVFHVASVSKQFTAMAVVLLAQDGLLSLQEDIHTYLPELPDFGHVITLGHLLHHTSGLRDQWELLTAAGWRMDDVITREQVLRLVQRQRNLNFLPGEEYLYCNTGFTLAAEIVARVSGQSLREFCAKRIFSPLGMKHTHFHDNHEEIVPKRAYSYAPLGEVGWRKSVLSYANVGATSLFTTVLDLARWLQNFDTALVGGTEGLREMETPAKLLNGQMTEYGLGLMVGQYRGLREIGHSGADAGFRTWCGRFPDHDLGIVILTNAACMLPRELAHQVAEILLPALAASEQPATVAVTDLDQSLLGEFFLLSDGSRVVIREGDGVLRLQLSGRPEADLVASTPGTWECPALSLRLVAQRDQAGMVNDLALQSYRMNTSARRLPQYQLSPEQLAEYAGEYYSEELAATYQLFVVDGQLWARHQRLSDSQLLPAAQDQFVGGSARIGKVQFVRDDSGQIGGMSWTGNRVRGVQFCKR